MNTDDLHSKPGRPRSEKARTAILSAALKLALTHGYNNASLQAIAAQAGVGRQTIYRWWSSKIELYLDVLVDTVPADNHLKSRKELELLVFLRRTYQTLGGKVGAIGVDLLLDVSRNSDKQKEVYQKYIVRRRQYVRSLLLETAAQQKKTFMVPIDVVTDMIIGLIWYRMIHQNQPLDEATANDVYQAVLELMV